VNNEYRKWTAEEVALLEDRATSSTVKELAEELGRPVKMVRWKVKKLGLTTQDGRRNTGRPRTTWTPERLSYLREHALEPSAQIAEYLGISVTQVQDARSRYGIPGRGTSRKHSAEEVARRIEPLRGLQKVDRNQPRECPQCGEVKPVFQYPSEGTIQSALCEDCRKEQRAVRHMKAPVPRRNLGRLRQYTLSEEDFEALVDAQEGRCSVCRHLMQGAGPRRMTIDHDHGCCPGRKSCGKCIRGLLCHRCNVMIGFLEGFVQRGGDPQRIVDYLS